MSSTATRAATPELIGPPPVPLRRDRMIQVWIAAITLSWLGDAAWMVALAWTAAHTLSPPMAGVVIGAEMIPQAAFVLVGGVMADRFDPRRILIAGHIARSASSSSAHSPGPQGWPEHPLCSSSRSASASYSG
jgi:MFS family permease